MIKGHEGFFSGVLDGIQNTIGERIASPLIFAFSTSWLIINFRFVLMILASESITYKIQMLNVYISEYGIGYLFGYPLLATLLYVFGYPFVAIPVNRFVVEKKLQMRTDIEALEGQQVVTEERLKSIQARFYDQKKEVTDENQRLQTELEEVRSKLEVLSKSQSTTNPSAGQKVAFADLNENEEAMLRTMGLRENKGSETTPESILLKSVKATQIAAKLALQNLEGKRYITTSFDSYGDEVYVLTKKGREAYLALPPRRRAKTPIPV